MKPTIRFEDVSKQYRLGLTRTSLPQIASRAFRSALSKKYKIKNSRKHVWAIKNVSFDVEPGQSLALVGPNGAGKTTVLKLLANITRPTSGQIEVNGKLSALIELGTGFHPDLTGRENIYLNGTILGLKQKEVDQRFDEIVDFSGLERFLDTPLKRYSSGMSVRLGFAVASCIEPDILLVDEVLAVGDASFRQKCIDRIHELLDKGTSIIFVSHNLWLVQAVCQSAVFIDSGQVRYRGLTSEVVEVYDRFLHEKRAQDHELITDESVEEASSHIEITNIQVTSLNGFEILNYDKPVEIHANYLARDFIGEVNFIVRIIRSDGLTCCMMRSATDGTNLSIQEGSGVVSLTLDPIQLRTGAYYAQVLVRDANDIGSISSGTSDWFYVTGTTQSFSDMNGVFEPERRWYHTKN